MSPRIGSRWIPKRDGAKMVGWFKEHALPLLLGLCLTGLIWAGSELQRWKYAGLTGDDEQRIVQLIRDEVHVLNTRIDRLMEIMLEIRSAQSACAEHELRKFPNRPLP